MKEYNNFRSYLFWGVDKLKGGRVRRQVEEIEAVLEERDADVRSSHVSQRLSVLLGHARKTCAYYQNLATAKSIEDFPIVDKTVIRANAELFISNKFDKSHLIRIVTSGSTGTPFEVFHDRGKRNRNSADTIVFARRAGFNVGDRLFYLKIWSASNHKNSLTAWLQNVEPFDVLRLDDKELDRLMSLLGTGRKKGVLGYASALEQVCKFLERNPGKIPSRSNITSALSMSEALSDHTKEKFKEYFNIDLYARYSNLENGILAQQFKESGNSYRINTASYLVEIFKLNEDRPAGAGEMGRIVITDLYNFGMPMIRYDTGDIGKFKVTEDGQIDSSILEHIEGRKLDLLFDTKGELISSYIMYKNMWKYTEITQYQLVQYGKKDYLFKINVDKEFRKEAELKKEFIAYLGSDANFNVEYVSEIPLLSSGKRKKIVNTFYQA